MEALAATAGAVATAVPVESGPAAPMAVNEKQSIEELNGKQGSSTMVATTSTAAVAESPKVSMMAKAGLNFVIPKNKLSGALVPVTRTGSKWEPMDPKKEEPKQPSRKTKWGPDLTQDPAVKRGRALALQTRAEQLAAQLESGNLEIDNNEATRSPSPPPLYDSLGHRMNTREGRKREQLDVERREAIGECMKLNPSYKPPSGFKPIAKEAKLFIPAKEHPGYNFIGLILGPRGNTQKRMEAETGAKITIRGKGAVKEGKMLPVRHGKEMDGAFEDLHVHISADTFEKVDAAVAIIEPLLTPVDEDRNMHKMKQLRELAEMNGTVRDFTRVCTLCGEVGHREWQCPKDKLQTFQAKVICRLCGDGGHPTIDCPLKITGQGKVFDKEYLNFLEELGTGLGGIEPPAKDVDNQVHPPGADTSQPMLLTASGAQPMPARWMASATGSEPMGDFTQRADGATDVGGFPRFPFPIPPGPHGMNALNFLLPRFFHPGLIPFGLFRGRPFPGPGLPMMARMLSVFRGRFPFPPFGLRPDMRPTMPSTAPEGLPSSLPMDNSTQEERTQALGSLNDRAMHANPQLFRGSLPASNTWDERENQDTSIVSPVVSSVAVPSFPSSSVPSFSSATAALVSSATLPPFLTAAVSPLPVFSPAVTSAQTFSSISFPNPLPPEIPPPALPPPPAHPITPSSVTLPVRPVIPSIRPALPSVRPVGPVAQQAPSFTHVGGLGQGPSIGSSSWGGTSSITSTSGNTSFPRPPQPWTGTATIWGQGQYSQPPASPQQSSPNLDKSSLGYAPSPRSFPTLSTATSLPGVDTSYSLKPWGNPVSPTPLTVSGPSLIPAQSFTRTSPSLIPSLVPPSFTPILPPTAHGQFVVPTNNQSAAHSSYSNPRLGLPPLLGPQIRSATSPNAMLPVGDYSSLSSVSQRTAVPQQSFSYQPQETPTSSRVQVTEVSHHGATFPTSEFFHVRPQEPLYPVPAEAQVSAVFRNYAAHQPGNVAPSASIFSDQGLRRPPMPLPPQAAFNRERSYSYDPSIPMQTLPPLPALEQRIGAVNDASGINPLNRSRPGIHQGWGQPETGIGKSWDENPQNTGSRTQLHNAPMPPTQEVDPEYEKLMASVGVL